MTAVEKESKYRNSRTDSLESKTLPLTSKANTCTMKPQKNRAELFKASLA